MNDQTRDPGRPERPADADQRLSTTTIAEQPPLTRPGPRAARWPWLLAAVVLAAIGVPDEEIVADHTASDAELAPEYERFKALHPDQAADVDAGIERRAWTMEQILTTLRLAFGSSAAYLKTAGVTADEIEAIRTKLTA
jgi:hypothetical protein